MLLGALRYGVAASVLLILGYNRALEWHLQHAARLPAGYHVTWLSALSEHRVLLATMAVVIIFYNTIGVALARKGPLVPLAVTLSGLDLVCAVSGSVILMHESEISSLSAAFIALLLGNLLFLGIPTLAVLFGRKAVYFALFAFFSAQGAVVVIHPPASAQIPIFITFSEMLFFSIMAYIIGHISEVEQDNQHEAERLALLEKSLRLEREVLVGELEKANELKKHFLALASHELRTPLHAMMGHTALLLEGLAGPLAPDQKTRITRIETDAGYLVTLIDDFLDLSSIEAGKLDLRLEPVVLAECIHEAVRTVLPLCGEKDLVIEERIPPDLPLLAVDYSRMKQVLINLLGNAAKYTEKGGIVVSVTAAGREAVIRVKDTGPGIPQSELSHLFEPYRRLAAGRGGRHGGSGLGLSIARLLVELHGGTISVESRIGEGSEFRVMLPLNRTDAAALRL